MDQAGEIVTHDLCQRLIDHRNIRSGAQTVAEFPLHHGEASFDVRPQVVPPKEVFPVRREAAVHIRPRLSLSESLLLNVANRAVGLERDERGSASVRNCSGVPIRQVPLVGRDFGNGEVLFRGVEQRWQLRSVVGIPALDFNGSNDVRANAAHDVNLDPIPAVFVLHLNRFSAE